MFNIKTNISMVLSVLGLGGHLLASGELQPGQLMAFLVASQGVQRSLSQGSILLGVLIRGMTAANRIFEVFRICFFFIYLLINFLQYLVIEPRIDLISGSKIPFDQLSGEVRFENVTFSYPSRPDQNILRDFNLVLKPGQTVALVGSSGSGKSTVASLLERYARTILLSFVHYIYKLAFIVYQIL